MPIDIQEARAQAAEVPPTDRSEIRDHVRALARPRLCGSEGADAVEAELRERFAALGYEAETLEFSFSTLHGRFGLMASAVAIVLGGVAATWLLRTGLAVSALAVLGATLALALLPIALGSLATRRLPWARVRGANLLFRRPGRRPGWILMAHRDSKGQSIPTLARGLAASGAVAAWLGLVALAALELVGVGGLGAPQIAAGGVLVACGIVLAGGRVSNSSPGALDNASGLAALLAVAKREERGDIAFLITDAEEMDLAGARDVATRLPPVQGVINVDGLDDEGPFYVAEGYGWARRRGSAPHLAAALLTAASALELPVRRQRLPRLLTADHVPLAAAGFPALTVLRGRRRSLLRVHRPGDSAERLDGRGAADGATLLAAAMRMLASDGKSRLAGERDGGP